MQQDQDPAVTNPPLSEFVASPSKPSTAIVPPRTAMRTLWTRMAEIYGHKWVSAFGDSESSAAGTWAKGLTGVTLPQLAFGLESCMVSADPWPPTLPEFRALCLGIPVLARVKLELHPSFSGQRALFSQLVWQFVDAHTYGQANGDRADRMLRDAYELAREHVMRGGALPKAVSGKLTAPEKWTWTPPPPEERAARIEQALREVDRQKAGEGTPA